ncbi:MAG: histidine triad nucleotide-binding protein [Clostridiales bacterium]|nr:histidine triad nucleotide-binding protein [Clostridiales bacterium]
MPDKQDCVFCKIIAGEIPSKKVYEDDKLMAFHDIAPNAPVHVLVIPKKHIPSLNFVNEDHSEIMAHIMVMIPKLAKELKVDESGYRVVVNCGSDSGMMVEHLHFHILGGRLLPQKLG